MCLDRLCVSDRADVDRADRVGGSQAHVTSRRPKTFHCRSGRRHVTDLLQRRGLRLTLVTRRPNPPTGFIPCRTAVSRVTGQLTDCQLADWTTRGLDDLRTGQLADATGDCVLSFRFLAASARPQVVQSAS